MAQASEMMNYFTQPGFRRLFPAIKRKYQSLGRFGGKVQLRHLTSDEKEILGGFLGLDLGKQDSVTVDVAQVDRIIRESRFALGLEELLTIYFGEKLRSEREKAREQEELWEQFFHEIEPLAIREKTGEWLKVIKADKAYGYRTLLSLYQENRAEACRILRTCIRALDELPSFKGERTRRPVFAARLTGSPHGLDRGTWLGRLLYSGIMYVFGIAEETDAAAPYRAERMREVFRLAGLEEDDLSSNVIVAGLRTAKDDQRAGLFENALANKSPLILPLRFFEQKTRWYPLGNVYVVENPTVFSAILDAWEGPGCPPLICPSGQPSVAALKLLDELMDAGVKVCYGGDFDGKGLEIGIGLWSRYGESFVPWFFDTGAYLEAAAGIPLSNEQRRRIGSLKIPWDGKLRESILRRGCVVYQEVLVENMVRFLTEQFLLPAPK